MSTVTILTGCFSYYQTSKSAALMAQFKNFIPPSAHCYRNGQKQEINAADLVIGDIVYIPAGAKIPADIILFKAHEMKVDNASLTGESEPLLRNPERKEENIFESPNVAFFGTFCTEGEGHGVVFKTGDNTVIGKIANLASSAEAAETPLSIEINRFIKIISAVAIILGVSFFIFGLAYGYSVITNLVFAIGIIVANVPEGLLATVTVSLALTAKRMATKYVLVKNLESVETLGSTSCICSDKTGTLTQNRMTVSHMFYNGDLWDTSYNYELFERDAKEAAAGGKEVRLPYDPADSDFKALVQTIILGTKATFMPKFEDTEMKDYLCRKDDKKAISDDEYNARREEAFNALKAANDEQDWVDKRVDGDASETGLIKFCQPCTDLNNERESFPVHKNKVTDEDGKVKSVNAFIPFSSEIKFNMNIVDFKNFDSHDDSTKGLCVVMKGAPDRIIDRCSKILLKGEEKEFTDELRQFVDNKNVYLAGLGERVLAFARLHLEPSEYTEDYVFDTKNWSTWPENKPKAE